MAEDLGMTAYRQIGLDRHGAVRARRDAQPGRRRRGRHAGGPKHGRRLDPLSRRGDARPIDMIDRAAETQLNTQTAQTRRGIVRQRLGKGG